MDRKQRLASASFTPAAHTRQVRCAQRQCAATPQRTERTQRSRRVAAATAMTIGGRAQVMPAAEAAEARWVAACRQKVKGLATAAEQNARRRAWRTAVDPVAHQARLVGKVPLRTSKGGVAVSHQRTRARGRRGRAWATRARAWASGPRTSSSITSRSPAMSRRLKASSGKRPRRPAIWCTACGGRRRSAQQRAATQRPRARRAPAAPGTSRRSGTAARSPRPLQQPEPEHPSIRKAGDL